MLQLLVAACLAVADGGVGDDVPTLTADAGQEAPGAGPSLEPELPAAPVSEAERRDGPPAFVKGELSVYLGSDRLTVKNTRIGVSAGLDRFEDAFYALVEPLVDLRFFDGKLGIGVGAPLRFEIFNFAANPATGAPLLFDRAGRFRVEDYDTFHDFGRVLKYVTYGRKEDNIYVSAGQRYASTVGHGAITRRYSPSIDIDYPRASAQVDMYNDYGGFELMTNDLLEWNQLSGLAFLKPLSFFKPQNLLARTFSVGVTGGLDWKAPFTLSTDPGARVADGRLVATRLEAARLIGFDAEVKVFKNDNVDLKPYVDYSMLLGGDGGFTAGLLGRFNTGTAVVHAFRLVSEIEKPSGSMSTSLQPVTAHSRATLPVLGESGRTLRFSWASQGSRKEQTEPNLPRHVKRLHACGSNGKTIARLRLGGGGGARGHSNTASRRSTPR